MAGTQAVEPVEARPLADLLAEAVRGAAGAGGGRNGGGKEPARRGRRRAEAIPDVELGPLFGTELAKDGDSSVGVRLGMDLPWFDRMQGDIYEAASEARVNAAWRRSAGQLAARPGQRVLAVAADRGCGGAVRVEDHAFGAEDRTVAPRPELAQTIDPVDISNQLRKLVQIRLKNLELRYQHNLIRTQLELLLGRKLTREPG